MRSQGLDPFDALQGRRVPGWLLQHPRARQAAIQLRKRCPIDLSSLFGVEPFQMAKTAGALLSAAGRRADSKGIASVVEVLGQSAANLGDGQYGYEFDVQTRWAYYPAGSPNLIATVFVARGLGAAGIVTGDTTLVDQMGESAQFLRRSLHAADDQPYFRYTLTSDRLVHNANLLGAGLVAMDASLRADHGALELALASAITTVNAQREDGSWPYGEGASLGWSDNFHTAYNLDGLLQVWLATGDSGIRTSLDRGVEHWVKDFFGPAGEPKYYPDKRYPYDIHSAGTAVDVAARLATWGFDTAELAKRVSEWTQGNLVDSSSGLTYYQKHRLWTDKRNFVRWGDAHWALGCSSLELMRAGRRDPLESAVAGMSGVANDKE